MTNSRPLLPILVAVLLGGGAHAGEFSLGGARLLAQTSAQAGVDVSVNFTDRGHASQRSGRRRRCERRTIRARCAARTMSRRREAPVTSRARNKRRRKRRNLPAPTTDSPHGVSISPSAAIRRPSYRWQSLVPGTIK